MLDPGHGGGKPGASFMGLAEKDVVLEICRFAQDRLQYHFWTAMTRNMDIDVPLSSRARLANEWKADVFVSVHTNADPDEDEPGMPEASGSEMWIYPGSISGVKLAADLQSYVAEFFPGEKFRGIKEAPFQVLKYTKMPAVLVEVGFIDNPRTADIMSSNAALRRIGHLLVAGIKQYAKGT
jgi:N-acetylmuramoyl-L-alanine amidase